MVYKHSSVLITGASQGLGRALALELARRGRTVVASARGADKLEALSPLAALFVGGMAYSSSSAIVTKVMLEQGWVAAPESAPLFGTLVVEDVVIAVYIAVLSVLATAGTTPLAALVSVGQAMVALCVVSLAGWYGTGVIDRYLLVGSDEHTVLRVLGVTALVAAVAVGVGLSEGVTAFFVGAAFGQRVGRRQAVGKVAHVQPHEGTAGTALAELAQDGGPYVAHVTGDEDLHQRRCRCGDAVSRRSRAKLPGQIERCRCAARQTEARRVWCAQP